MVLDCSILQCSYIKSSSIVYILGNLPVLILYIAGNLLVLSVYSRELTGSHSVDSRELAGSHIVYSRELTGSHSVDSKELTGSHGVDSRELTGSHVWTYGWQMQLCSDSGWTQPPSIHGWAHGQPMWPWSPLRLELKTECKAELVLAMLQTWLLDLVYGVSGYSDCISSCNFSV